MPYPLCITRTDSITYKMCSNVIQRLSSTIQTFNRWTEVYSTNVWCIFFRKLQEIFNPILILVTYARSFHPTSIHLWCTVIRGTLSDMHDNLSFFIKKLSPYPIQEDNFLLHSNKQVKTVMLNLTKFWQHLALVSK